MSLRRKMAKGALWALLERGGAQGVSFVVFTVIARLLGPEEYGLVSLCYVYLALASALLLSMTDGVINLHIRDNLRLSTLFWGLAASGLILSFACFLAAGPFAALMEQPRLVPLLRWFSLLPLLLSFSAVPTALVSAHMNFRIFTIRTLVATVAGGGVGIVMAIKGFGAYAIVAQQLVLYAVMNLIIWPGSGWHPRLMFSAKELSGILKPGLKMSGSSLISFVEQQMPRLLIGHFLGPASVGYFAFVSRIRQALQEILVYPLSVVSYPAFAYITEDHSEQKKILGQLTALTGTLVFPVIAGGIVTASLYVPLLFGAKWEPAIPVLQLFLITGALIPFLVMLRDLLRAHNRTGSYLRTQAYLTGGGLLLTLLLVPKGLVPMSWGLVALSVLSVPVYVRLAARKTKIRLWKNYARLGAPLLASLFMASVLFVFDASSFIPPRLWAHLLIDIALGGCVYGAGCLLLQFRQMAMLFGFLKKGLTRRVSLKEPIERLGIGSDVG
jgi:O-antigen/teichoic acid export membrane protein